MSNMNNAEIPTSIAEHFDAVWWIFMATIGGLVVAVGGIFRYYAKKIDVLESNQKKVMRAIPDDAFQHGYQLMTEKCCADNRSNCSNVVISEELTQSMKIIKQAIMVLVLHTDSIPKEDKERIVKGLVQ